MKIIQVSPYFTPHIGGSEWYCQQLSKHLAEKGHEVHVITSKLYGNSPFNEERDGYRIERYPCAGIIFGVNPATFIMHRLMKMKADVVHAHSYIFLTSNQAALTKKLTGTPFLLHLHGGIYYSLPRNFLTLKSHMKKLYDLTLGRWTVQAADAVASVSKVDIELAENLWNLNPKKLHWIPNAINIDRFNRNCGEQLNVIYIGRLETWKGLQIFLEAAELINKEHDNVKFSIVGDGSLRNYVEAKSKSLNVKVFGQIPHNKIPDILAEASILVLPSYMEGLPTVCLEALASEVPVVASNVGGTPEVVLDGETGYLIPSGNAHLCAEKVLKLLNDEQLRNRMGRRGRHLIEQFYTWKKVVEKTEKIYETIGVG